MLLLLIAIIVLVAVIYYTQTTQIIKLNECPDVFSKKCDVNPCNCPNQRDKPKYQKTVNYDGVDKICFYCGKQCITELNEPNNIKIKNTNDEFLVNDIKLNADGSLSYTPEYAYLEGEIVDCACENDNLPVRKTILTQDNDGNMVEKTGYICGGNPDGSRKHAKNDVTKDIFIRRTADREIKLEPKKEVDVTEIEQIITQTGDIDSDQLKKDFSSNIQGIVDANVNVDEIEKIKQQVAKRTGGACPQTQPGTYLNKLNKWVVNHDYIFSGNPELNDNVTTSCSIDDVCDCSNNDEMMWKIKDNEGIFHDCKTCGKLICPNEEDASIQTYTNKNGIKTILSCSEIMYNGLNNEYLNKCQCNNGRQLNRREYTLHKGTANERTYTCDTCEEVVNACPANITLDNTNNDRCTLDSSCQCPRDQNGALLVKYPVIYYGPGNMNIKTSGPNAKYQGCYMCGYPINSLIYDLCEDKNSCNISSKLQTLLNDIDSEIKRISDTGNVFTPVNDSIKTRINEYFVYDEITKTSSYGNDNELEKLNNKCLPKHTIWDLFSDILKGFPNNYIDTANELAKRKTCNDIAHMSSEIDTGDGVNCRYTNDEDELFSIMGKLTYEKDYNASDFPNIDPDSTIKYQQIITKPRKIDRKNKQKLSNIIKYFSDDMYNSNRVLRNCSKTCDVDYKKHYNIDAPQIDNWGSDICGKQANMYCPSYSNVNENQFFFSRRVKDFCANKNEKCNAYTYIKHENENYINNRVKGLCPNSCWKCDENAVMKAREEIKFLNNNAGDIGVLSKQEENDLVTVFVNESKQLREQINTGLDVLTSRSGFTKYVEDLKFNILDMVNRWDFKYQLANDKEFVDKCNQNADDNGVSNFLEFAGCHIVDSKDKVDAQYRTDKSKILDGIYGYCTSPEKSNWMNSIMENCANSAPGDESPICLEMDNSNSFPFKLDGVKDCFGSVDISDSKGIIGCINSKMSNACVGDVRELQDSYNTECRKNFQRCVTANACGAVREYVPVYHRPKPECKTNSCINMINYDIPDGEIPECGQRGIAFWDSVKSVFGPPLIELIIAPNVMLKNNDIKFVHNVIKVGEKQITENVNRIKNLMKTANLITPKLMKAKKIIHYVEYIQITHLIVL